MNRFSRENLGNIKKIVSEETGVSLSAGGGRQTHYAGVLILVIILVLGATTAFAMNQFRISKNLFTTQEHSEEPSLPEDPGIYDHDGNPVYQAPEGGYSSAASYSGQNYGEVNGFVISYPFGDSGTNYYGLEMHHDGIDIVADKGTPVLAAADGIVRETGYEPQHGNYVIIDHEEGYSTTYGCLQDILAEAGAEVKTGDQIGTVGATGMSTGPHLHLELRLNGEAVDPSLFWDIEIQ